MNLHLLMIATALVASLAYWVGKQNSKFLGKLKQRLQELQSKPTWQESKYQIRIKKAQEALFLSERRYSTLAKIAPVGIFHTSATGDCLYVNQRWCEIAGITAQEAVGKGWSAQIHPEERERVLTEWYRSVALNLPFKAEYRFQRRDGSQTWVQGQAMAEMRKWMRVAKSRAM
jgi:PAS domain S-box-containing protein